MNDECIKFTIGFVVFIAKQQCSVSTVLETSLWDVSDSKDVLKTRNKFYHKHN